MRLIEVLERQTRYLSHPLQSRYFLHGEVRYFCQTVFHTYSILARTFPTFSQLGNAFAKFQTFPDRENPVNCLT